MKFILIDNKESYERVNISNIIEIPKSKIKKFTKFIEEQNKYSGLPNNCRIAEPFHIDLVSEEEFDELKGPLDNDVILERFSNWLTWKDSKRKKAKAAVEKRKKTIEKKEKELLEQLKKKYGNN